MGSTPESPSAFPDGIVTPGRAFKRLTVDTHFTPVTERRVLVEWAMLKSFVSGTPGPYTFTLERNYSATGPEFVAIAQTVDQPWAYDNNPVFPQKGMDVFYRVKLTDANGTEWFSQSVHASTSWDRYDWTIAREIIRKETLLLRKKAGTKGWLLKRRLWGEQCTACTNPQTGQILDPLCEICFGTGIVGGYYDAFEYWVLLNPSQRIKKLDADRGLVTSTIETVRALAYPSPAPGDIWANAATDQRYLILGDIVAAARHRGISLVLNLRLDERSRSEGVYLVPVPCR